MLNFSSFPTESRLILFLNHSIFVEYVLRTRYERCVLISH